MAGSAGRRSWRTGQTWTRRSAASLPQALEGPAQRLGPALRGPRDNSAAVPTQEGLPGNQLQGTAGSPDPENGLPGGRAAVGASQACSYKAARPWCVHEPRGQDGAAAPGAGGAEPPRAPSGQGARSQHSLWGACVWAGVLVGAAFEAPWTRPELHFPLLRGKECHIWKPSSFLHGGAMRLPPPQPFH